MRYAAGPGELGAMEIRVGWEEMRELEGFQTAEALFQLAPGGQADGFGGGFAVGGRPAGLPGDGYPGDLCGAAPRHGFATSWYEDQELVKYERCDDGGEILALVDRGHLEELRWERIPPIAQVIDAGAR